MITYPDVLPPFLLLPIVIYLLPIVIFGAWIYACFVPLHGIAAACRLCRIRPNFYAAISFVMFWILQGIPAWMFMYFTQNGLESGVSVPVRKAAEMVILPLLLWATGSFHGQEADRA